MASAGANPSPGQRTGQKRSGWEHGTEQPSKRRAAKACLSCRNRKVRCDVLTSGHPCTNCRLDAVDCVVIDSNRGRKPGPLASTTSGRERPPAASAAPDELHRPASPAVGNPASIDGLSPCSSLPLASDGDPNGLTFQGTTTPLTRLCRDGMPTGSPDHPICGPSAALADEALTGVYDGPQRQPDHPTMTPSRTNIHNPPPTLAASGPYLPPYIKPLPRHITSRDLTYLADKGALTIPDDALRDEILRAYVALVYPFMPTIHLQDFLAPIIHGEGRGSVSLLLFQAVMFSGVSVVNQDLLKSRGYRSKKAARKALYGRVRLLYALECEQDHVTLLQAVLLMTYWYDCPEDGKNSRYWTGIAWSIAQVIGIHREPELCRTTLKDRQLRRRIWWSCVMQDRLLSLGIRRPCTIRDEDFDVPQLTLDDFDLDRPPEPIVSFLEADGGSGGYASSDPTTRATLAVLCIELSKLAVCVGHILHSQYPAVSDQPMIAEYLLRIIMLPKRVKSSQYDVGQCDTELNSWLHGQDPRAKYQSPGKPTMTAFEAKSPTAAQTIRLHQILLHMNYLAAVHILHRPQILSPETDTADDNSDNNDDDNSGDSSSSEQKKLSQQKVADAAVGLTKLAFDLQMSNQLQYLSTSSVPAYVAATLSHLVHIRSNDEELRNISVGRLYQCMHVLQTLQSMYSSADYAVHFLGAVLKNVNIKVPSLMSGVLSIRPDWKKPQLLGCQASSEDKDPALRVDTAYPSPCSCPNHIYDQQRALHAGMSEGIDNHHQTSQGLRYSGIEPWSVPGADMDGGCPGNLAGDDYLLDAAHMGHWLDIRSLVPALMNFDAGNSWAGAANNALAGEGAGLF